MRVADQPVIAEPDIIALACSLCGFPVRNTEVVFLAWNDEHYHQGCYAYWWLLKEGTSKFPQWMTNTRAEWLRAQ